MNLTKDYKPGKNNLDSLAEEYFERKKIGNYTFLPIKETDEITKLIEISRESARNLAAMLEFVSPDIEQRLNLVEDLKQLSLTAHQREFVKNYEESLNIFIKSNYTESFTGKWVVDLDNKDALPGKMFWGSEY